MKTAINNQDGISAIGVALIVLVLAVFFLVIIKLAPLYFEYFQVNSAIKATINKPEILDKSNREIAVSIIRQLEEVEHVNSVKPEDIRVSKIGKTITVDIDYEVYRHLFGNIGFLVDFSKTSEATQ